MTLLAAQVSTASAEPVVVDEVFSIGDARAARGGAGGPVLVVRPDSLRKLEDVPQGREVAIRRFPLANGRSVSFTVRRFSVFAPGATIEVVGGASRRKVDPPEMPLFEGVSADDPHRHLFLALGAQGEVWSIVRSDAGVDSVIGPAGGFAGLHERLAGADLSIQTAGQFCGAAGAALGGELAMSAEPRSRALVGPVLELELFLDVGNGLFTGPFAGNVDVATGYVTRLVGALSALYQRDLGIAPKIVGLNIWADMEEPFSGSDTQTQFDRYQAYNITTPSGVPRDVSHYLANVLTAPDALGRANLASVCQDSSAAVSNLKGDAQQFRIEGYVQDLNLLAHETGHNLGSRHTHCYNPPVDRCAVWDPEKDGSGAPCYTGPIEPQAGETMSYCAARQMGFSDAVRGVIRAHAEAVDCLAPKPASCGDGVLDQGEACDDGNRSDGDCCNATCTAIVPCHVAAAGTSKIFLYKKRPASGRKEHFTEVQFTPGGGPSSDWLRHGTRVRVYYKSGAFLCVEGVTPFGRTVRGWVAKSRIKRRRWFTTTRLGAPPPDPARRVCAFESNEPRSSCATGCDPDRPDARPGQYACGAEEPRNSCYTGTLCTVRQTTDLLYDPGVPGKRVHKFKRKKYCVNDRERRCESSDDCGGRSCRKVDRSRWSRLRLKAGRRVGLATKFTGGIPGPTVRWNGVDFVWVASSKPTTSPREVLSGWVRRSDLCCEGDHAAPDNPASCGSPVTAGALSGTPSAEVTASAVAAGTCAVECCDGTGGTFEADDQQDCIDLADEVDVCERGPCDIARLEFDGVEAFARECTECCALCSGRTAHHVVLGGCDDCAEAAADYCAVGRRGALVEAVERPWGSCIQDPPGECRIGCCDGTWFILESASLNECTLDALGLGVCGSAACDGPQLVMFNEQVVYEDACELCEPSTTTTTTVASTTSTTPSSTTITTTTSVTTTTSASGCVTVCCAEQPLPFTVSGVCAAEGHGAPPLSCTPATCACGVRVGTCSIPWFTLCPGSYTTIYSMDGSQANQDNMRATCEALNGVFTP